MKSHIRGGAHKAHKILFSVLIILFVGLIVSVFMLNNKINTVENSQGEWECIQTECSRLMTQQEIMNNYCSLNNESVMLCSIFVEGQTVQVPLNQLNFSAIQACAEETCIKEIQARPANYTIDYEQI